MSTKRTYRIMLTGVFLAPVALPVLAGQAGRWQKTAEYGWSDITDAPRALTGRERALGGGVLGSINGVIESSDGSVWVLD